MDSRFEECTCFFLKIYYLFVSRNSRQENISYIVLVLVYSVLRVQKDMYLSSYDGTKNEAILRGSTNRPSVTIVCTGMFFLVIVLFGRAVCIYSYNSD